LYVSSLRKEISRLWIVKSCSKEVSDEGGSANNSAYFAQCSVEQPSRKKSHYWVCGQGTQLAAARSVTPGFGNVVYRLPISERSPLGGPSKRRRGK